MKKLNAKLEDMANTVGVAAHSDPKTNKTTKFDCRGGRLCPPANKQNGITLIALIITIIVMLILVGVTINVALNGNLFGKADDAKRLTQIAADKEELQMEILTAYNEKTGEVELSTLKTNLEAKGWRVTISGDKAICTSPKGNTFTVDKKGKITEGGTHPGGGNEPSAFDWSSVGLTVDTSTEYIAENGPILNFSVDGKLVVLSNGMVMATVDATNSDNIDATTGNLSFDIEIEGTPTNVVVTMNANNKDVDFTLEGMGTFNCVKIVVDNETIYSNEEVLKALGITNYTGTYNGTWTVIGTENGKTKLVSTSSVTTYTLGYEDPEAISAISIAGSEPTEAEKLERAIWSYKNASDGEETLNTAAKDATGIASARSVNVGDIESLAGIQDSDKGTEYLKEYKYDYTDHKDQVFVTENGETIKIDSSEKEVRLKNTYYDKNLSADEIGTLASGYYWLASPCVECSPYNALFSVRCVESGRISHNYLFQSSGSASSSSYGVRAVVSI